jgi:N-acetylmuramoyl-L-alanine amidase
MRRVALLVALAAVVGAAPAWGADVVTLSAQPSVVAYDGLVRFSGATVPLSEVFLVQQSRAGWTVVAQTRAGTDGAFVFERQARTPGVHQARTLAGQSGEVATRIRPVLRARLNGSIVTGRVLPARAGSVVLRVQGRTRRLRVGSAGRFRTRLGPLRAGRHAIRVSVRPGPGYVRVARRFALRVRRPALRIGSHGPGVLALKRRLADLGYALPSVDSGYGFRTFEAVIAFQKVHGLPRTGDVDRRVWRALERASRPRPRVPRGDYLEVSKSRQTLYEVRDGEVERVIHVSTGATGNTPVGTWRVYREVFGWDWVLYHPMYFLRGFAIHGYPSVPAWPASHGCVRIPLWLASGLRERWGYGSVVRVYG